MSEEDDQEKKIVDNNVADEDKEAKRKSKFDKDKKDAQYQGKEGSKDTPESSEMSK